MRWAGYSARSWNADSGRASTVRFVTSDGSSCGLFEAHLKKHGSREHVQALYLLETFDLAEVTLAIEDALRAARYVSMRCATFCCAASSEELGGYRPSK